MIGLLRRLLRRRRVNRNRALATRVGDGTELSGFVDRRASAAVVEIGRDCLVQGQLVVERDQSRLIIGDRVSMGGGTIVDCAEEIMIENDVIISYECLIADSDNHSIYPELRVDDVMSWKNGRAQNWDLAAMKPVRICEGAWLGARSIVLKGVTIGPGSVVGAGSVVTIDVPPRTIVAGNPARVVRSIGDPPRATSQPNEQ